jgi:hypothetical protein
MERAMVISSTLETLPTHIVTSPSVSLRLVRSFCFKSPIIVTEPVSNTHVLPGVLVRYTLITRIYFEVASLLIYHAFGVIPLPVTVPLTIEALSLGFGFNLGFLHWSGNWFAIHEVSLLALALLETSGLVKPSTLDAPS